MLSDMLGITKATRMGFWRLVFKCALQAPYLLDQVLALSAAHMSTLYADQRDMYRSEATELQTRALSLFNSRQAHSQSDNDYLAVFLYSSLLGLHCMFSTLLSRHTFNTFMDEFADYLLLHRGVRAVLTPGSWALVQAQLCPIIGNWDFQAMSGGDRIAGHECDTLRALLDASDMDPASSEAYRGAVESLQWAFDLHLRNSNASPNLGINVIVAWLIIVPAEFVNMVKQRRPEAMVILAHYAVLLHDARSFWVFGDGGSFLIRSISAHLGTFWEEWLAWPNEVLVTDNPRECLSGASKAGIRGN